MPRLARSIAISELVNSDDPALPVVGGGMLEVRVLDPAQSGLSVLLNGATAIGVTAGFDAVGDSALLVPLNAHQPAAITTGLLTVQVIKYGSDGHTIVDQSSPVTVLVCPGFAALPVIDGEGRQLILCMALPAPTQASAAAMLFARGGRSQLSQRIACAPRTAATNTLTAPLGGIFPGDYLVGVEIDGIGSLLEHDGNKYTSPLIVIPEPRK